MRPLLPLLPIACVAAPAMAQQHDAQGWLQVNTVVPLADGVRVTLEQIARTSDRQQGVYQSEFGGILGLRVAEGVEIGFGYRKVGFHSVNRAPEEDRLRQHVVWSTGPFQARLRVDQRFVASGGEVGFRVRPQLRYNHRLARPGHALFVSHESFWLPNSTDWGQRRGYERMRNIAGAVLPLGRTVSADLGYLNQYRLGRGGGAAVMEHALLLQLTISPFGTSRTTTDD
jgi:hypothetical protein